jgi:PIN domain nuclease of toxin-antitoxin system
VRIILDTVTFIWAVSTPERLSRAAMSALRKTTAVREISVVSLAEIAVNRPEGSSLRARYRAPLPQASART